MKAAYIHKCLLKAYYVPVFWYNNEISRFQICVPYDLSYLKDTCPPYLQKKICRNVVSWQGNKYFISAFGERKFVTLKKSLLHCLVSINIHKNYDRSTEDAVSFGKDFWECKSEHSLILGSYIYWATTIC